MKWFEGSINEAVATSKSRKAIFVVFIEGKDDTSKQVAEVINATDVSTRLEQEDFVAIRLESGSETYRFFAQIYQLVPVPSLFFIGENGTPLEIVAGNTTASELLTKIDSVVTKAGKSNKNSSLNLIDAEQKAAAATSSVGSPNTNVNVDHTNDNMPKVDTGATLTKSISDVSTDNNNAISNDTTVEASTSLKPTETTKADNKTMEETCTKELTPEEKLERAKQLIELQRKERVESEEKKERERELARRRMGQDVQKMRQKQQDLEVKQAHEERMREKAAEAAAKEKVRQQIAQDKLERKQKELALQQQQQQQQQMQQQNQEQPKFYASVSTDATVTRIQFKLPSGNPHMGQFDPKSTLRALRTYVIQNIELPFRHFAMSTSFPRRDLTPEEDNKTLLELELVPTAVILILPLKNSNVTTTVTSTQDIGFVSRIVWFFVAPIIGVYNYLTGYFAGGTQRNPEGQQNDSATGRDTTDTAEGSVAPNLQNVANSGLLRRYLSNQGGTTIRAEGNIHRLHSGGDDNDENNTWNGNSTQQM